MLHDEKASKSKEPASCCDKAEQKALKINKDGKKPANQKTSRPFAWNHKSSWTWQFGQSEEEDLPKMVTHSRTRSPFSLRASQLLHIPAKMNREKLMKMASAVRTGGKGIARRNKKVVHKTTTMDDNRYDLAE